MSVTPRETATETDNTVARAGLTRETVVMTALEMVDADGADGFSGLTLSAVAARAGVAVPSLYKHVASLADLRRALSLVAVRDLTRVSAEATIGRSGDEAVSALAHALRDFAKKHPARYSAAQVGSEFVRAMTSSGPRQPRRCG